MTPKSNAPPAVQLISIADLRRVVMECSQCKTQIFFDITLVPALPTVRSSATPASCPACDNGFDSGIQGAVDLFRQAYNKATAVKNSSLMFRIEVAADVPCSQ